MFDNLTDRLSHSLKSIGGKARLTEENIQDTLREVRKALLEADVALPVVKDFVERIKERAVGQEVSESLNPGQQFVKIVETELIHLLGDENETLDLAAAPPAVVLMAGLQGAGKTTSVAKLARYLHGGQCRRIPACSHQATGSVGRTGRRHFPSQLCR
jgi:signal recognition particle subunit SRP54